MYENRIQKLHDRMKKEAEEKAKRAESNKISVIENSEDRNYQKRGRLYKNRKQDTPKNSSTQVISFLTSPKSTKK